MLEIEFISICKAIVQTNIYPDFITVDGGEGGTGAAPLEYSNSIGMPLTDGLSFVVDCLNGFNIKKHIKIIEINNYKFAHPNSLFRNHRDIKEIIRLPKLRKIRGCSECGTKISSQNKCGMCSPCRKESNRIL